MRHNSTNRLSSHQHVRGEKETNQMKSKNPVSKVVLIPVEVQAWEHADEDGHVRWDVCEVKMPTHEDATTIMNTTELTFNNVTDAWEELVNLSC